jgi:protoheme IX farnesyltransferase
MTKGFTSNLIASHSLRQTFRTYYYLTKPGIIYGNLVSAIAGFLFAAQGTVNWPLGLAAVFGTALVIASGCVLNNYIDREIDAKMARTSKRALVRGTIPEKHALIFAAILCLAGFVLLSLFTTILTVYIGLAGLYCYVVAYGYAKRRGAIGTIVGSFAGATPIIAGYTAVSGTFDTAALLIFLAMVIWQMPHFYAIAIFRYKDYASAGIPTLPIVKGIRRTKLSIMIYILVYTVAVASLALFDYATYYFFIATLVLNAAWFWKGFQHLHGDHGQENTPTDDVAWARRMFGFSLIVMLSFSALLSLDSFIH